MALNEHAEKNTQAESHRKPPSSVTSSFLWFRVKHQLDKIEGEPKPNAKRQWPEYETLRDLAARLRNKAAGFSLKPVLAFAGSLAVVIVLWLASTTRHVYSYQHPQSYLRVIQNLDPCLPDGSCGYRYLMQLVVDGQAQEPTQMHFCKGLQPRFEQGHTLKYIVYANLGSCQAIERFDLVRENGVATLAANCKPDYSVAREFGHIACEGGKARF